MSTEVQADLQRLFDSSSRPNPYPVLQRLREASPCPIVDGAVVLLARHADCSTILRNRTVSSKREGSPSFFSLDPPEHTRLRGLTAKAFTPKRVDACAPRIRATAHELVEKAATTGSFDLVSDYAYTITARTICDMFGVPDGDHEIFRDWTRLLTLAIDPQIIPNPIFNNQVEQARLQFNEYFAPMIADRRAHPRDDLITALINVTDGGDHLTETELLDTFVLLIVAAHENPVGLIGNTMLALLNHPDQLAAVRENPELAAAAVEETLRYDAPAQMTGRTATEPIELGDLEIQPGTGLFLMLAAANRDPDAHPDPDRFDISRASTNHLAFAAGPHFCMGADLAKLEARIAVEVLTQRLVDPAYDPEALKYKPNVSIRGPLEMPMSFSGITSA
ncbi:cytochrome P450 [Salinactinospora qingdaonensis]|uniref:Cytochrome P450 n=1 Tax=Salinactinospora qingdaonensis TaxID=702744 RepID=A0ABP7FBL7_9ACTN